MPAVTIVAAWINADTGVGPAMASGNQVYNGICALLPVAPTNKSKVMVVISPGVNLAVSEKTSEKFAFPIFEIIQKMAIKKPRSPIRFITNALLAALLYSVFLNQYPISKYEHRPTPSQPMNMMT